MLTFAQTFAVSLAGLGQKVHGHLVTGHRAPYRYLPTTAKAFPSGERFLSLMRTSEGAARAQGLVGMVLPPIELNWAGEAVERYARHVSRALSKTLRCQTEEL